VFLQGVVRTASFSETSVYDGEANPETAWCACCSMAMGGCCKDLSTSIEARDGAVGGLASIEPASQLWVILGPLGGEGRGGEGRERMKRHEMCTVRSTDYQLKGVKDSKTQSRTWIMDQGSCEAPNTI
jgi:hypothetical protein